MLKTAEGKWILFAAGTGEQGEFWSIDAKAMLAAGTHTTEPPAGVDAKLPAQPPRHVGAPQAPVVQTFVGEDGTAPKTPRAARLRAPDAPSPPTASPPTAD